MLFGIGLFLGFAVGLAVISIVWSYVQDKLIERGRAKDLKEALESVQANKRPAGEENA